MKLIEIKCQNCGSVMKVDTIKNEAVCEFCGAKYIIDNEVQRVQYENAEQAGYEFEKGRQKAQSEQASAYPYNPPYAPPQYTPPKKKRTWLWVLGWIFIFPLPLTILMVRNKNLNIGLRIGIVAVAWLVYLSMGFAAKNSDTKTSLSTRPSEASSIQKNDSNGSKTDSTTKDYDTLIDSLVMFFNWKSNVKLDFYEDFEVQNKRSGHYRTEFRLSAYDVSMGKSYKYNDVTIDIVARKPKSGNPVVRLYASGASLEENISIVESSVSFFDSSLTKEDIKEITDYLMEHKEANGYDKGNVGIVMSMAQHELLIKYKND